MSIHIQPPTTFQPMRGVRSLFIGGGISHCPNWQKNLLQKIEDLNVTFLNPRRDEFDITDNSLAESQIKWEFDHLRMASEIVFWFPKDTLCPITLYELGAWSMTDKKLFIGTEPGYARAYDVLTQTKLVRPEIELVYSITDLSVQIMEYYKGKT
jgi:hypothetical protein